MFFEKLNGKLCYLLYIDNKASTWKQPLSPTLPCKPSRHIPDVCLFIVFYSYTCSALICLVSNFFSFFFNSIDFFF